MHTPHAHYVCAHAIHTNTLHMYTLHSCTHIHYIHTHHTPFVQRTHIHEIDRIPATNDGN